MIPHLEQIRSAGAELHAIGSGRPEHLAGFVDELKVEFPSWTDPGRKTFEVAGFKRGLWSSLGPGNLAGAFRALGAGHRQGPVQGDTLQQGGVLLIGTDGAVRWSYVNEEAADHASPQLILEALSNSRSSRP